MKTFFYVFAVLFFFICGVLIVQNSPHKAIPTEVNERSATRDPAAIKKVYDFSHLDGQELEQASKSRLISGARISSDLHDVGIELGHFVVRSTNGEKTFACQIYAGITLVFEGEGSASSGKKPSMEVEGKCEISSDVNSISPLWIPVSRILLEPVADGDFDFRDGKPAKVHFANLVEEWPLVWRLRQVRLNYVQNPNMEVTIEENELKQYSEKPIFIQFKR